MYNRKIKFIKKILSLLVLLSIGCQIDKTSKYEDAPINQDKLKYVNPKDTTIIKEFKLSNAKKTDNRPKVEMNGLTIYYTPSEDDKKPFYKKKNKNESKIRTFNELGSNIFKIFNILINKEYYEVPCSLTGKYKLIRFKDSQNIVRIFKIVKATGRIINYKKVLNDLSVDDQWITLDAEINIERVQEYNVVKSFVKGYDSFKPLIEFNKLIKFQFQWKNTSSGSSLFTNHSKINETQNSIYQLEPLKNDMFLCILQLYENIDLKELEEQKSKDAKDIVRQANFYGFNIVDEIKNLRKIKGK